MAYATADSSARAALPDRDYQPASGTVTIPAGELGGTIEVFVLGDRQPERDESATVTIGEPAGAPAVVSPASDPVSDPIRSARLTTCRRRRC